MAGEDIVEVSVFTAAVHVPMANEPVSAATLKIAMQSVADRTKFLNDKDASIDAKDASQDALLDVYRGAGGGEFFPFVGVEGGNANMWDFSSSNIGVWTQASVSGTNVGLIAPIGPRQRSAA